LTSAVSIALVETKAQIRQFINYPFVLYKENSQWRPPLRIERAQQLDPKKNPGAPKNRALFLAKREGRLVGRISAFINDTHNQNHSEQAGFFGYFDCIEDRSVANALLVRAEDWVRANKAETFIGPAQWSVNEECGLLTKGFEFPQPIMFENGLWVGYVNNAPVAFICMIPDINELTQDLDGKLLPFGWIKLLWRLKVKGAKQARIPLMGLRKSHQNTRKGLALVARLCEEVFAAGRKKGFTHCELSWILENNTGMIGICEEASAVNYKTYRMYEKAL